MTSSSSISDRISKAEKVREAAQAAVDLLPSAEALENDPEATVVEQVLPELAKAQDRLQQAWNDLEQASREETEGDGDAMDTDRSDDKQQLRADYIAYVTDAFAEELAELQESSPPEDVNVELIADCLQSGMEIFPEKQIRGLIYADQEERPSSNELTPHQRRRKYRGFD